MLLSKTDSQTKAYPIDVTIKGSSKHYACIFPEFSKPFPERCYVFISQGKREPLYKLFSETIMNSTSKFLQSYLNVQLRQFSGWKPPRLNVETPPGKVV